MKRLIWCAALLVLAVEVSVVTYELTARAGDVPRSTEFISSVQFALDSTTPRQQLLERLGRKVELMTDEQIEQALETTDAEIRELDADKRLREVKDILAAIVKDCAGTRAAASAARMVDASTLPDGDGPAYYPTNDPPQTVPYYSP